MWKLMTDNAITQEERAILSEFILKEDRLSQGDTVKEFENKWSEWLGCKYSVFVNSGSSANLLLVHAVLSKKGNAHELYVKPNRWAAQACTWSTTVSPILQGLAGAHDCLYLTDVDLNDFSPDLRQLEDFIVNDGINYLFLTHLLGFPALSQELLDLCEKHDVSILEDCCEAHGATFQGRRVGTFGVGSTFSFYYGHHMTTIEGGMVCTNDEEIYHKLLLLRSHGLLRELPPRERKKQELSSVDPAFCFVSDGYNLRNTELHAKLGIMQLKGLDTSIEHRNKIFNVFLNNLNPDKYKTDFKTEGCSNFSLPLLVKDPYQIKDVKKILTGLEVEHRPCIAGNLNYHPLVQNQKFKIPSFAQCSDYNADKIHRDCVYIGNHKDVTEDDVITVCKALGEIT